MRDIQAQSAASEPAPSAWLNRVRAVPDLVWTLAIILIGFGLRVYRLGDQSLWFDEAFTWWTSAVVPPQDFVPFLLPFGAYTPAYYLITRGVTAIGSSEYLLRFPSVIFGVLAIPLIERVARRMGGQTVARVAALLLAVNPFHIWYSQDARMYTLAGLGVLAAMDGFMHALMGRGWRRMILAASLAYVTHYVTLFLGYSQLLWWLPRFRRQIQPFRRWFASNFIAALPLIAWELLYLLQAQRGLAIGWIPHSTLAAPLLTFWNFTSADVDTWTLPLSGIALVVAVTFLRGAALPGRWRGLLLAWLLVPPISTALLSLRVPSYMDRYLAFCLYAWLIVLATGITQWRPRWLGWLGGGLILGLMLVNTARLHTDPLLAKEDWRGAAAILNVQVQPGERIGVQDTEGVVALRYYYRGTAQLQPIEMTRQPDRLDQLTAGIDRVWLVYRSNLESNHRLTKSQPFDVFTQTDEATQRWLAANCRAPLAKYQLTAITVLACPGRE